MGYEVVQLVRAPCYNLETHGFVAHQGTGVSRLFVPYGLTLALDSTQPLTEMSTRDMSWE
jgi:hypothetical protein